MGRRFGIEIGFEAGQNGFGGGLGVESGLGGGLGGAHGGAGLVGDDLAVGGRLGKTRGDPRGGLGGAAAGRVGGLGLRLRLGRDSAAVDAVRGQALVDFLLP
jgi:hypothetical protein